MCARSCARARGKTRMLRKSKNRPPQKNSLREKSRKVQKKKSLRENAKKVKKRRISTKGQKKILAPRKSKSAFFFFFPGPNFPEKFEKLKSSKRFFRARRPNDPFRVVVVFFYFGVSGYSMCAFLSVFWVGCLQHVGVYSMLIHSQRPSTYFLFASTAC